MSRSISYSQNQLRDYSTLFSPTEAKSWLANDFSNINYKIDRYDKSWRGINKNTYLGYLKYIYNILEANYQNEYVFKNNLLTEWLFSEIDQKDVKVFNEFRVGNAIADLVVFNGISKAYEVKTEYDSDNRLTGQLHNYKKAFNQIFLIIPESKLSIYEKYGEEIGLITFNANGSQKFTLYRDATTNYEVDSTTIMNILHTKEYKKITELHYGKLPEITSFNQFDRCKELIDKIQNDQLNKYFIDQMKKRGLENAISSRYYREFNQLSLALKLNNTERKNMIEKLKSQLN
ncbi:sce7726 family protein [uncultured Roseivirga sp.]|uniref:sce7726 family protein n=1 Tax=uncultured Roseivirga sp. TaxID=543088 RepID=UPI0030DAE094|tara:strand:- start:327964 stop:328830 length:867 start_codon:yes stop_codon:yes gene_type:complete